MNLQVEDAGSVCATPYINDVVVLSNLFEEHLQHLQMTYGRVRDVHDVHDVSPSTRGRCC